MFMHLVQFHLHHARGLAREERAIRVYVIEVYLRAMGVM